jgi:multidrug efflux pump subunit AcrA (membrane-fusion protein)
MFEEEKSAPHQSQSGFEMSAVLRYVLLAAAAIYVIATLYLMFGLKAQLTALQQKQAALETSQADLVKRIHTTSSELKQTLTTEVGVTKQELAARAAELQKEQQATAAAAAKLAAQQSRQSQQIAAVNGEVSGVKTDVGAAKTDIQKTQTDLAATNAKLEKTIGDLGVQSGLVAHNASELEELRRKGERNYYNFTLQKNARTPVGTVSLQLKKVDAKKSRFTLDVMADDRTIEKKDKTVSEPLQFYTGRDHLLYELVVFTAGKNSISGYLATPKNAPVPVTP